MTPLQICLLFSIPPLISAVKHFLGTKPYFARVFAILSEENDIGKLPIEAEDGLITAEDVKAMDLTNIELVVLSAGDTGLVDVLVGKGVFGLHRSFVLAGAKTLVMSMWKVSDEQTSELMILFYEFLIEEGKTRSDALRSAQMAIKERYPNTYYWAAFICQGDPGSLSDQVLGQIKGMEV